MSLASGAIPAARRALGLGIATLALLSCSGSPTAAPQPAPADSSTPATGPADPNSAPVPTSVGPTASGVSGASPQPVPGKVIMGHYLDLSGMTEVAARSLRRGQLGRDLPIVHLFYAWEDPLPDALPGLPAGTVPMLSWRGTQYQNINSGASDAKLADDARALARYQRPVFLRWGWEMNGDWYPWCGVNNNRDTAGFIAAWRRMHDIFARHGADNVAWVWSPNHNSRPREGWNDRLSYYPGDDYVDWVGVSGYNYRRETAEDMFGPIHREFATRKPLMISEVGAVDRGGRTKADWITALAGWITAHPEIAALVWFDTDTHPSDTERWRIDQPASSLQAYQQMARTPRFGG